MNIAPRRFQPQPLFNARLLLFLLGFAAVCAALLWLQKADWWVLRWTLQQRFPGIEWIETEELARWLEGPEQPKPLLLDVRTAEEFAVSHLPGARRIEPGSDPAETLAGVEKETAMVTYCAVGYRSGEMVRRLQALGFANVRNLDGSIFAWANEGRPLVREGRPVSQVHPYGGFWTRFLDEDRRAPLPP